MRFAVAIEIRKDHIGIRHAASADGQKVGKLFEAHAADAVSKHIDHAADAVVIAIILSGLVAALVKAVHLIARKTEDEDIILAHALKDLHVCAVHRADGDRAVDHKLHVARTRGFLTRHADLLAHFGRGHDELGKGYAVVFKEHHLDLALDIGVVVDHVAHRVDQADDEFCHVIAGRRLCAENKGARRKRHIGVLFEVAVHIQNVQCVQKLPLILVQSLYLHVKDAVRIHRHAVVIINVLGKALFVRFFDLGKFLHHRLVVRVLHQSGKVCVLNKAVPDQLLDVLRQKRVCFCQPATVRDAVGHVGKASGVEFIHVVEHFLFQDLAVQGGHAVDGVRSI